MNRTLAGMVATLVLAGVVGAGMTSGRSEGETVASAATTELSLATADFLTGTWVGESRGGVMEEIWSVRRGGNMMGMFRWLRPDETAIVYEMMTLTTEDNQIFHRLRHNSPVMHAVEPQYSPMEVRLVEAEAGRLLFRNEGKGSDTESIEYKLGDDGQLVVTVTFPEGFGRDPLVLSFKKQGAEKPAVD